MTKPSSINLIMPDSSSVRIIIVGDNLTKEKLEGLRTAIANITMNPNAPADMITIETHDDVEQVTDGYHSFDELYQHRHALCIALFCELKMSGCNTWYSHKHHDGTSYPAYVLVGADLRNPLDLDRTSLPVSYQLPVSYIPHLEAAGIEQIEQAPHWDGHTSHDVITRLLDAYGNPVTCNDADDSPIFGETIYEAQNPDNRIVAFSGSDERVPSRDMLGHVYGIGSGEHGHYLHFQQGPVPQYGANGTTNEAVLSILIHRTEHLNAQFQCAENEVALEHMRAALRSFEARTAARLARGVEGKEVK